VNAISSDISDNLMKLEACL